MTATLLNWNRLGRDLRIAANDAHEENTPSVAEAYCFLLENSEMFSEADEWPEDMPADPPFELIAAYYGAAGPSANTSTPSDTESPAGRQQKEESEKDDETP